MKNERTFLGVLVALLILSVIFLVIERVVARLTGHARPQPVLRRGWKTDVVYWFMTALITSPVVRIAAIIPFILLILAKVTTLDVLRLGNYQGFGPLARQPVWLQAI